LYPLNGSAGTHDWQGFIAFDDLPQSLNPLQGFIVAANNRPVDASYPYYLGSTFASAHRAQRITQLLNTSLFNTIATMRSIQLDTYSLNAAAIKDIVAGVILNKTSPTNNATVRTAATYLQSWDCRTTKDSIGAAIWVGFLPEFLDATFSDEYAVANVPSTAYPSVDVLENFTSINYPYWFNNTLQSGTQTRDDIILISFANTVTELINLVDPNPSQWQYGDVHILWMQHVMSASLPFLDAPRLALDGSAYSINFSPGFLVTTGATWRQLIDLASLNASLGVLAGGQRGNPYSTHYLDQLGLWVAGNYHPLHFPLTLAAMDEYESILVLTRD
jgi:penicillin amidase